MFFLAFGVPILENDTLVNFEIFQNLPKLTQLARYDSQYRDKIKPFLICYNLPWCHVIRKSTTETGC